MNERILVVDDDADTADALARLIRGFGYEAQAVFDGAAAIALVETFLPDMVLLDIGMPGLDGFETVARLRQQRGNMHLIVVAVTGWTRPEDKQRAYESGFDLHVAKPISGEALKQVLALLNPSEESEGADDTAPEN